MLIQLSGKMNKFSENCSNLNKDIKILIKDLSELKNIAAEMKNTLQGINSKSDDTEERISNPENRIVEVTQLEGQKEKRTKKSEDSIRDLWYKIKRTNIGIIGVSQGEKGEKGMGNLLKK